MIDLIPLKPFVIAVFFITYILIIAVRRHPQLIAWLSVAILLGARAISPFEAFKSINLNVLGIFCGTMILSSFFVFSGVPKYLSAVLVNRSKSVGQALLLVCILAGAISAFVENVTTLIIIAPIALEVARRLDVSPVPFMVGIAVSANLQGCATMVGDSPSIILAGMAHMSFNDFIWMNGKPGLFFAVQFAAIGAFLVLHWFFKQHRRRPEHIETGEVKSWFPTILLGVMIFTLAAGSLLKRRFEYLPAVTCLVFALIGTIWYEVAHKERLNLKKDIDWKTFFFLAGIFVLVGALSRNGIISDLAAWMAQATKGNMLMAFLLLVWVSVLISAFVDNIPYTMGMIPVAKIMALQFGVPPWVFLFGLLIGTCLGGNITPIGASCNVVAVGILRKEGHHVSFMDFARIGIPLTVTAVVLASAFIWFIWS